MGKLLTEIYDAIAEQIQLRLQLKTYMQDKKLHVSSIDTRSEATAEATSIAFVSLEHFNTIMVYGRCASNNFRMVHMKLAALPLADADVLDRVIGVIHGVHVFGTKHMMAQLRPDVTWLD
jgi:hypothetical protein